VAKYHHVSEPETIEDNGLRIRVSGDYMAVGEHGVHVAEGEWMPSPTMLPTWVEFELDGHDEPDFHCRVEIRDKVPRLVELGWCAREHQSEIRQKHLRETEVSTVVNAVYGSWVVEIRDDKGIPGIDDEQSRIIRGLLHDLRAGRRHVNAELLQQVAAVYRANFNKAPAEAVARTFGVKQRMAHEYVRRARERGFLPPTTQGKKKI
jgi:hypothetical protein